MNTAENFAKAMAERGFFLEKPAQKAALEKIDASLGGLPLFLKELALQADGSFDPTSLVRVWASQEWILSEGFVIFADYLQLIWAYAVSLRADSYGRVVRSDPHCSWVANSLQEFFEQLLADPIVFADQLPELADMIDTVLHLGDHPQNYADGFFAGRRMSDEGCADA